jgi:uncharacterized protein (DUF1800 family)
MAFALSEIMVTSDSNGLDTLMMAEYADLLARDAFGNYRTLLGEVTYSPTMAQWLTYVRNRAAYTTGNPPTTISPDQNYAREVMQLFSFGLIKRNLDYSPLLVNGLTQATYDNTIIATMARVFTGLSYDRYSYVTVPPDVNVIPSFGDNDYVDYMRPMLCFPMQANNTNYLATGRTYHDNATKTIFDGRVLPAVANTLQGCNADINAALDEISAHPSVAPFISRQLIQRFVSSNPSPQYISRVANVFNNNGSGVYGDLSAVLKTILMDPEARGAPTTNSGKLREPLLRISALWRGLDVVQGAPETAAGSVGNISMGLGFNSSFNQRPYNSPTVFNFFEPDYQNPGALQLANLYSPEFQILNESSITGMNDTIQSLIANWYVGSTSCTGSASNLSRPCIPFAPYVAMLQTANATTYAQLVDELNLRTMYGSMSANMRTVLIAMLTGQTAPTTDATRITRIQQVLRVIIASPEFAVQR